jgi:3',5'-cyclic AMP phosphodiesterase CpdA
MRVLVHLSDIHFGAIDREVVRPLIRTIQEIKPDLVAVSGDLTQRAREQQFRDARAFLDALPKPQIVVPGNHDVPLYNVFNRFAHPLDRYRRYITDDISPFYADEEIVVAGVNTARSFAFKGGRINHEQVAWLRDKLCLVPEKIIKTVVTHHPFEPPEGRTEKVIGRAKMAIETLADCGADLYLSGHVHVGYVAQTARQYQIGGRSSLVVQAGTATSTRGRGEANSFNVVRIAFPSVTVERWSWRELQTAFRGCVIGEFRREPDGWARVPIGMIPASEDSNSLKPS